MQEAAPARRLIKFGAFEVDPHAQELRKSGLRIKLQDQPFQVLSMLLDRPGELVTRDELRQRLWPDGTFVDYAADVVENPAGECRFTGSR